MALRCTMKIVLIKPFVVHHVARATRMRGGLPCCLIQARISHCREEKEALLADSIYGAFPRG